MASPESQRFFKNLKDPTGSLRRAGYRLAIRAGGVGNVLVINFARTDNSPVSATDFVGQQWTELPRNKKSWETET